MKRTTGVFFILSMLFAAASLADTAIKKTNIYNASLSAEWQYHQPQEQSQFDYTTARVELKIWNKTIIPLTFGRVKVRHHCKQMPDWMPKHNPQYSDRDYSLDFAKTFVAKRSEEMSVVVIGENDSGPCGGGYGGVTRSEIITVEFSQHNTLAFDQHMQCGNRRVPVVWALAPNLKKYLIYTDTQFFTRKFETIRGREGSTLQRLESDTKISLLRDICDNSNPDEASKNRWRVYMIKHIQKWVNACSRSDLREKCKAKYENVYRGWSEGSTGVRG